MGRSDDIGEPVAGTDLGGGSRTDLRGGGGDGDVVGSVLVARAVAGEGPAIEALWREHRRWVAAVILAHKPREVDVEDLLQDVAMTFVRSIGELRDQATLRPWLRTVAINAALAAGRKQTRRREGVHWRVGSERGGGSVGEPGGEPSHGEASGSAVLREDVSRLMELSMELPEGYREPLLLKSVRGMSYREIGAAMGLPETTVETRIARGRRMLREAAERAERGSEGGVAGGVGGVDGGSVEISPGSRRGAVR